MTNINLTKSVIAHNLQNNPKWLKAGIIAIFNRQTEDEKIQDTTNKENAKGFTGCDAQFGSSLAKRLIAGGSLSVKQEIAAKKMMNKYAGQLLKVVKEKIQA
jgi:hypothetical protein